MKGLPDLLKKALGSIHHFLALDVIAALELRSLFGHLLQSSENDESGYSYHVINALMGGEDRKIVAKIYLSRLEKSKTTAAAKMTILDSLGRMRVPIDMPKLYRLLSDADPEVRSATLYYIRSFVLKSPHHEYLSLLKKPLQDEAFQVRIQDLFLISELSKPVQKRLRHFLKACENDLHLQVKALCLKLSRGGGLDGELK